MPAPFVVLSMSSGDLILAMRVVDRVVFVLASIGSSYATCVGLSQLQNALSITLRNWHVTTYGLYLYNRLVRLAKSKSYTHVRCY